MQTIYIDNTNQYIYVQLYDSNNALVEGTVDGEVLSGITMVILPYKQNAVTVNPASIVWILSAKVWQITIPKTALIQFGNLIISLTVTSIKNTAIDVHVGYPDITLITTSNLNAFISQIEDDLNNLGGSLSSIINTEVTDALNTYDVPTNNDLAIALTNTLANLLVAEIKDGRSIQDILRIVDLFFTGIITNAGSGLLLISGSDGSTISVVGDEIGNRSNVSVNLL
jgi:hypothetical protein